LKRTFGFSIVAALTHIGCSGGSDIPSNNAQNISGYEYVVISRSTLSLTADAVSGDGEIAFTDPAGSTSSNQNFQLEFLLDDGGSLELKAFANNTLSGGVKVRILRDGDHASISATTEDSEPVGREIKELPANGLIALSIDVHNSETPAHVLVWRKSEKSPTDDNAVFNSDADGVIPGNGIGMYWGLALEGAKVSKVATNSAEFAH
jgi:hypothetical protein